MKAIKRLDLDKFEVTILGFILASSFASMIEMYIGMFR